VSRAIRNLSVSWREQAWVLKKSMSFAGVVDFDSRLGQSVPSLARSMQGQVSVVSLAG
jgi:hypothetical protein